MTLLFPYAGDDSATRLYLRKRALAADAAREAEEARVALLERIREVRSPFGRTNRVQQATAVFYGVTVNDIISHRRTANVVFPRQVAMYLAKQMTTRSLPEIGMAFRRDHTTVLHNVRKIAALIQTDAALASQIEAIAAIVGESE